MKARFAAAAAVAATSAYAQSVSYTTVTYDDCVSASMETMITVTNGVTVTYCPECEHSTPVGPGYTTTYTTVYQSLCPTGMVGQTYTITESCTEPTPTWTPGPSHIPQGYTVTTRTCHVCGETPMPVTITEPCGCEAHEGTPGPPAPTHGRTPATTTPGSNPSTPTGETCNGEDCGGSGSGGSTPGNGPPAPPYPTTGGSCPGPNCRAVPSPSAPGISGYGNTSNIVPSTGMAPSHSSFAFVSSSIMAVVVAALAFAL